MFEAGNSASTISVHSGGDVDYELVTVAARTAIRSGNGLPLASGDGNNDADYYLQFSVPNAVVFEAQPSSKVQIEVEYLDNGTDTFSIQYDASAAGAGVDPRFKDSGLVTKTGTGAFQTAVFSLCDAFFGNRTNGGDFRIADSADGADTATYSFTGLEPGLYNVAATWPALFNRTNDAVYAISDGGGDVHVNQQLAPSSFVDDADWEWLSTGVLVTDGALDIVLSDNDAAGFLIADAIRVELVPEPASLMLLGLGALLFRRRV